jgi:hypothetical protein
MTIHEPDHRCRTTHPPDLIGWLRRKGESVRQTFDQKLDALARVFQVEFHGFVSVATHEGKVIAFAQGTDVISAVIALHDKMRDKFSLQGLRLFPFTRSEIREHDTVDVRARYMSGELVAHEAATAMFAYDSSLSSWQRTSKIIDKSEMLRRNLPEMVLVNAKLVEREKKAIADSSIGAAFGGVLDALRV